MELYLQQRHYGVTIELSNLKVHDTDHTVLHINTTHAVRNAFWLKNWSYNYNVIYIGLYEL